MGSSASALVGRRGSRHLKRSGSDRRRRVYWSGEVELDVAVAVDGKET